LAAVRRLVTTKRAATRSEYRIPLRVEINANVEAGGLTGHCMIDGRATAPGPSVHRWRAVRPVFENKIEVPRSEQIRQTYSSRGMNKNFFVTCLHHPRLFTGHLGLSLFGT
jgi:hypothetical protein